MDGRVSPLILEILSYWLLILSGTELNMEGSMMRRALSKCLSQNALSRLATSTCCPIPGA